MDVLVIRALRDWAEALPEAILSELATGHLSLSDIESASRACKPWHAALRTYRRAVPLLPTVNYPPQLFCRRDTICTLRLSAERDSPPEAPWLLSAHAAVLAANRLPALQVTYSADEALASSTWEEARRREHEAGRQDREAAAAQHPAGQQPMPHARPQAHPLEPYYDLSSPLIHSLTTLLNAPCKPGRYLRRLILQLPSMPAPQALQPLATLPSLDHLQLLGGSAAFLEASHLAALRALTGLTALSLSGVWDIREDTNRVVLVNNNDDEDDEDRWWLHVELPWAGLMRCLRRLRALHLHALGLDEPVQVAHAQLHQARRPLQLQLHALTGLQELRVLGRQLNLQVSRLGALQHLTRLELDRALTAAEWAVVWSMEGLVDVSLRAEVKAATGEPVVIGRSVVMNYGSSCGPWTRQVTFSLPAWWQQQSGMGVVTSGVGGSAAGREDAPRASAGPALDLFAAAAAAQGAGAAGGADFVYQQERQWREGQRVRLRAVAELHFKLEPLRFLRKNTSLTRLKLHWPGTDNGDAWRPMRSWFICDAVCAVLQHARGLGFLSELRDVELSSPGGEVVLDGSLLEALAPAWRHLRRFAFSGIILPSIVDKVALFTGLQELSLHDTASRGVDHHPKDRLLLRTSCLPRGLQRLSLTNTNVLHTPGTGIRGLQRLKLGEGCRWQAARPQPEPVLSSNAPAFPVAAPPGPMPLPQSIGGLRQGPWVLSGLPLLTHLDLQGAPVGAPELRAVLGSCGVYLRALSLSLPEDRTQAAQVRSSLVDSFHLLPALVRLAVRVGLPAAHLLHEAPGAEAGPAAAAGGFDMGGDWGAGDDWVEPWGPGQAGPVAAGVAQHPGPAAPDAAAADPEDGGGGAVVPVLEAQGGNMGLGLPHPGAPQVDAAARAAAARRQLCRTVFRPLRRLVEEVITAAAAAGSGAGAEQQAGPSHEAAEPAGAANLARLRQLWLHVVSGGNPPWSRRGPDLALVEEAACESLAGLRQLSQLQELRLAGPLLLQAAAALERRLVADMPPHCCVHVTEELP